MSYCSNCGAELEEAAKFYTQCGRPTQYKTNPIREVKYAGKLIKCPNCGENVPSFQSNCPLCGYEIRETESSGVVREFAKKLEAIEESRDAADIKLYQKTRGVVSKTDEKKITLIRNFPIPNTKEDLFEFIVLAASNIHDDRFADGLSEAQKALSDAWQAKFEQAYQKAKISFSDATDFGRIEAIYAEVMQNTKRSKKNSKKSNVIMWVGVIGAWVAIFAVIGAIILYSNKKIEAENNRLEVIADEVISCIEDHNYTRARSKAATIAFAGDDDKSKEKWDTVREELLKQIDRAEQEYMTANNTSSAYSVDEESLITQASTG